MKKLLINYKMLLTRLEVWLASNYTTNIHWHFYVRWELHFPWTTAASFFFFKQEVSLYSVSVPSGWGVEVRKTSFSGTNAKLNQCTDAHDFIGCKKNEPVDIWNRKRPNSDKVRRKNGNDGNGCCLNTPQTFRAKSLAYVRGNATRR